MHKARGEGKPTIPGIWTAFRTMGKNKTENQEAKPERLEPKEPPGEEVQS